MAESQFRLPDSSYEDLVRIIRAYNSFPAEASPAAVGRVIKKDATGVSRNTGFLTGVGILEGGRQKQLSQNGRQLARALDHELESEVVAAWRRISNEVPFFNGILSAVRIRRGMEVGPLRAHVAYSAGQPRTGRVMAGAGAVIDILRAAALLTEVDGKLVAVGSGGRERAELPHGEDRETADSGSDVPLEDERLQIDVGRLGVQIRINVDCKPADLPGLAKPLIALLEKLRDEGYSSDTN